MPNELPTPPAGLAMIVKAAGDPDVSMHKLADLVSKEPSLTAALLKLANSAAYGVGREIRSIPQATVLLGTRAIRNIAVSHAVRVTTQAIDAGKLDLVEFWEDSLRRATAALVLARKAGYEDPSEAFTAGLLQDVGVLVMAVRWPEKSGDLQAFQKLPGPVRLGEERRITDTTHPEVFAATAAEWGLPADMISVIALHHDDAATLPDRRSSRLLQICRTADALADLVQTSAAGDSVSRAEALVGALASREPLDLESLVEDLNAGLARASEDFQIRIGEQPDFKKLMSIANESLIRINLSYEEITRQLEETLREKAELMSQLQASNEALARLAATDVLTGVANRRSFTQAMGETLDRARADATPVSFLMLDIDHFKKVNDTYGHQSGDDVLKAVCERLGNAVRTGDLVGRLGGEEFGVLLPNCPRDRGIEVGERLRLAVKNGPVLCRDGREVAVTGSFGGITVSGDSMPGADEVLRRSDEGLYQSKAGGRDRVTWVD